jgi:hypothetical protein
LVVTDVTRFSGLLHLLLDVDRLRCWCLIGH